MAKQTIGEFLATLRKANGYTQQEVADRLGISNRTLSGWECNNVLPDILLLPALAELYGVTVDEILSCERKERAEVELTNKSEKRILKSKIARFSTQSSLLIGLIIIGVAIAAACVVVDMTVSSMYSFIWWLSLLVGSVMAAVSFAILFAFWKGAELFGEDASDEYYAYCLILRKKLATCLYVVAAENAVATIVVAIVLFARNVFSFGGICACIAFGVVAVALFATGWLLYKNALTRFGGEAARHSINKDRRYFWVVGFWGFFPILLSAILATVLGVAKPTDRTFIYENSNSDEFVEYMETFVGFGTEKHFPLSELAKTAKIGEEFDLGDGYVAVYHRYYFTITNEQIMLLTEDGDNLTMVPFSIEVPRFFLIEENGTFSCYNVRYYYNHAGETGSSVRYWFVGEAVEIDVISCGGNYTDKFVSYDRYAIERVGDNGMAYVHKVTHDYSLIGYSVAFCVISVDLILCAALCVLKRNRFFVKL